MTDSRRDTTWCVVFRLDRSHEWLEWGTGHRTIPDAVRGAEVLVQLPVVKEIRFERVSVHRDRFTLAELDHADDERATLRDRIAALLRPHASLGGTPQRWELPYFDGATPSLPRISGWRALDEVVDAIVAEAQGAQREADRG